MSTILLKLFLAIIFVISSGAAFSDRFKRYRALIYTAWLFATASGIYSIYGINEELNPPAAMKIPIAENISIYGTSQPIEMKAGDTWGKFSLNGNCVLKFANATIHRFSYVGNNQCNYRPTFSPSPSGRYVVVFVPTTDYGLDRFAIVDTVTSQVLHTTTSIDLNGARLTPVDSWSRNEEFTVVGKWFVNQDFLPHHPGGGISSLYGFMPCVLNVSAGELNCPKQQDYINRTLLQISGISIRNKCFNEKTCSLFSEVDSATWEEDVERFNVSMSYIAEPTSNYRSTRPPEKETLYSGAVKMKGDDSSMSIIISSYHR